MVDTIKYIRVLNRRTIKLFFTSSSTCWSNCHSPKSYYNKYALQAHGKRCLDKMDHTLSLSSRDDYTHVYKGLPSGLCTLVSASVKFIGVTRWNLACGATSGRCSSIHISQCIPQAKPRLSCTQTGRPTQSTICWRTWGSQHAVKASSMRLKLRELVYLAYKHIHAHITE